MGSAQAQAHPCWFRPVPGLQSGSANFDRAPGVVRRTRLMGKWRGEQRLQGLGRRKALHHLKGPHLEELYRAWVDFTLRAHAVARSIER